MQQKLTVQSRYLLTFVSRIPIFQCGRFPKYDFHNQITEVTFFHQALFFHGILNVNVKKKKCKSQHFYQLWEGGISQKIVTKPAF